MPPFLQLLPHVSYGLVGSIPVFLDLLRDRYFALDAASQRAFGRLTDDAEAFADRANGGRLLATGLFSTSTIPVPVRPVQVMVPTRSALEASGPRRRPGLSAALAAYRISRRARRSLEREPLLEIIERERARRTRARPAHDHDLEELARCFRRARALMPPEPVCLPDSLALLEWLARRSAYPALVFGVKLHPFGAHCWVQTDEAILSDAADVVADFTPVLAIR
jgi:hypothetical protein